MMGVRRPSWLPALRARDTRTNPPPKPGPVFIEVDYSTWPLRSVRGQTMHVNPELDRLPRREWLVLRAEDV